MVGLIWGLASLTYVVGALISLRVMYIKRYKRYLRWKAADPDKRHVYQRYGYDTPKSRKTFTYWQYCRWVCSPIYAPAWSLAWPVFAPGVLCGKGLSKFCFPEVKIPDVTRIDELENL